MVWLWVSLRLTLEALSFYLPPYFANYNTRWKERDMLGKTVVLSGGSTGIGRETALALAQRGCKLIIVSNEAKEGALAVKNIRNLTGNNDIWHYYVDLSNCISVRLVVDEIRNQFISIDVLINNAGVLYPYGPLRMNSDGVEMHMSVNYLGHFLLTNLLLPLLEKSNSPARIIMVSSSAQKYGRLNPQDFANTNRESSMGCYYDSKLAVSVFSTELSRRLSDTGITVNCLHPGIVGSPILRSFPKFCQVLSTYLFMTPKRGSETSVYLSVAQEVEGFTGMYFSSRRVSPLPKLAKDKMLAKKLWDWSCEITGLKMHLRDMAVKNKYGIRPLAMGTFRHIAFPSIIAIN